MRLWHQSLIPFLPRQQLLGQHRECCALRGNGWDKKHSTVDYAFKYSPFRLFEFHLVVMYEMLNRNYNVEAAWFSPYYRGKNCYPWLPRECWAADGAWIGPGKTVYLEHDDEYLKECLENLKGKGINICAAELEDNNEIQIQDVG